MKLSPSDTLAKVLADWMNDNESGVTLSEIAAIRQRLKVTYNTNQANTIDAGSGLDWFWETYSHDQTNRKPTDLLN